MSTLSLIETIEKLIAQFSTMRLLRALIVGLIAYFICNQIIQALEKLLAGSSGLALYQDTILKIAKIVLFSMFIALIAFELGLDVSFLLMLLAFVVLVFLYAAKDYFENIVCGLIVAASASFKKGDYISAGGKEGTVRELGLNCTKLETLTGEVVTIPNKNVSAGTIVNYTALGRRAVVLKVGASYENDPEAVMRACEEMLKKTEGVLPEIPPKAVVAEYGDSNIEYCLYFWVRSGDYLSKQYEITGKIYRTFRDAGIQISYPRVMIDQGSQMRNHE